MPLASSITSPVLLACGMLLAGAAITDLLRRTIPNSLTLPALCCGCLYLWLSGSGTEGFVFSVMGTFLGGLLFWLPYRKGMVGGGDLKLMAALGAWIGPKAILSVFLYATVAGGLMAVVQIWRQRSHHHQERCQGEDMRPIIISGQPAADLPYALAIGSGFLVYLAHGSLM